MDELIFNLPLDWSDLQLAEDGKISVKIIDIVTPSVTFRNCREVMDIEDQRAPWNQ